MEPLHIAICEDQAEEKEALLALLAQSGVPCVCTVFSSGEALLEAWRPHEFDLLLMDIYMDGITGLEAVKRLREQGEELPVAFITSSTDHALDSYRLSALKYIEKPVRLKDVTDIVTLARLKKQDAPSLAIHRNGRQENIPVADICYLEQQGHVVNIHLKDETVITTYEKIATMAVRLADQPFFQPHKSYLVHLAFVARVNTDLRCFVMTNGKNIPIRRELMGKARRAWEYGLFARNRRGG